jgi:hypothetical protein
MISQSWFRVLLGAMMMTLVWLGGLSAQSAIAASNQDMHQEAMLIAPDPKAKIPVYVQPDTRKSPAGWVQPGTPLTVIRQLGSNEGFTWDYAKFDNPNLPEGWVKGTFVALQTGDRGQKSQAQFKSAAPAQGGAYTPASQSQGAQTDQSKSQGAYAQTDQSKSQ